jgi:hypothetical protein
VEGGNENAPSRGTRLKKKYNNIGNEREGGIYFI